MRHVHISLHCICWPWTRRCWVKVSYDVVLRVCAAVYWNIALISASISIINMHESFTTANSLQYYNYKRNDVAVGVVSFLSLPIERFDAFAKMHDVTRCGTRSFTNPSKRKHISIGQPITVWYASIDCDFAHDMIKLDEGHFRSPRFSNKSSHFDHIPNIQTHKHHWRAFW